MTRLCCVRLSTSVARAVNLVPKAMVWAGLDSPAIVTEIAEYRAPSGPPLGPYVPEKTETP